jgi:excisionase family DNA binding protein
MSTHPAGGILQNEVLTVNEVATYLRVSRVTVWRWCQRGIIPASQVGRNWRIRRNDLLALLETTQSPTNSDHNPTDPTAEVDGKNQTSVSIVSEQTEVTDCLKENSDDEAQLDVQDE